MMTNSVAPQPAPEGGVPPRGGAAAPEPRLVYVDALRVAALAGVFVVHVCEVFNPADEWHITNAVRAPWAGALAALMAPWIMPLFFVLSGAATWYSLRTRGSGVFIRERVNRLLLPLVVGTLLFVPPQVYLERRLRGQFSGSFVQFIPHFFQGIYPQGNLSWHHLWFLAHLFAYSVIALPLFRYWQTAAGELKMQRLARLSGSSIGLLALALPLVLERELLWGLFPERHMLSTDWANHALLLVAFVYGFVLAGAPTLGAAIDRYWKGLAAAGAALSCLLAALVWAGALPSRLPPPYSPSYLVFWTLYAVDAWACMVAVLGAGRRWLRVENRAIAVGRANGFAWYVVHQPVIVALAYVIVQWPARVGVGVKFTVLFASSLAGTLALAQLLRHVPGLARILGYRARA